MDGARITSRRHGAPRRLFCYAGLFLLLCAMVPAAGMTPWHGDAQLHTLLELAATLIAMDMGLNALVRYYRQTDDIFLFIGSGFIGTAVLNGYHAAVTSTYFVHLFPSAPPSLVPWSGFAPRLLLSAALFLSWAHWLRQERLGREGPANPNAVHAIFAALTLLALCLVAFVPLPRGMGSGLPVSRPQEFLPSLLLAATLAGYLRKDKWRRDVFERWLVVSLALGLVSDLTLAFSGQLDDARYTISHCLKVASFLAAYAGVTISMQRLFRQASREGLLVIDRATGAFLDLNQRACDLFGYGRSEMLRLDVAALSRDEPSHDGALARRLAEAPVTGRAQSFEWPCRAKDGRPIWIELSLGRGWSDDASAILTAAVRDITERKRAEDELCRRDAILHAVTLAAARLATPLMEANLPEALEIVGKALGVSRVMVLCNPLLPQSAVVAGWQQPEFAADFARSVLVPIADRAGLVRWYAPLARGRCVATTTRTADPAVRALLTSISVKSVLLVPIFANGTLWGLIGIDDCDKERAWTAAETDTLGTLAKVIGSLVEREAMQASLRSSEQEFRTIFDTVGEGIFLLDPVSWRVVDVNPQACTLFGYPHDDLVGREILDLSPFVTRDVLDACFRAAKEARHETYARQVRTRDGHLFWADISYRVATLRGCELALVTVRDATERHSAEEQLRRRDNILHAVTLAAAQLARPPLKDNLAQALEIVGLALGVGRVLAMRNPVNDERLLQLVAAWQAPETAIDLSRPGFPALKDMAALARWHAPLAEGLTNVTMARTAEPPIRDLLDGIGVKSLLEVPIFAGGALWGFVAIDECLSERTWTAIETDALGTLAEVIGSLVEREAALASLHRSEEEFHTIFTSVGEAIFLVDPATGRILEVNPQACAMFGFERTGLIGLVVEALAPDVTLEVLAQSFAAAKENGRAEICERRVKAKDGREFWAEISVRNATYHAREVTLASLRDITGRKKAQDEIARMARIDALTGLPNRREFVEVLEREIARCQRDHTQCAVLYLDLDHFKDVNDTLGHPVGDRLLQAVAERLKSSIRAADSLARFGGDEFAVLQTDLKEPTDAALLAAKIVDAISAPCPVDGNEIRSGASVGIAVQDGEPNDAEAVLSYADVALYRAKAEGRGTYRFFTDAMDAEVRKRVTVAGELRQAIERDELYLVYQPQVDVETDRIVGVEALVRWRHPRRGLVPPSEFSSIAEDTGIIVALGKWVLRQACRQMRQWLDQGIAPDTMAINVSAVQFKMPLELERDIAEILASTGTPPDRIEIELTESVLMEVWREHNEVLQRLHRSGIRVAIDDFGTGYSSLDYLHRYPLDHIKIAQVFVADPQTDPGAMAIVKAAIGLARDLNLGVIVEGVESAAQARQLRAWGCGEVQGFHYAKPLPADEIEPLLKTGRVAAPAEAAVA